MILILVCSLCLDLCAMYVMIPNKMKIIANITLVLKLDLCRYTALLISICYNSLETHNFWESHSKHVTNKQ